MRSITVVYANGSRVDTNINGSDKSVLDYYLGEDRKGRFFSTGLRTDEHGEPEDVMALATEVIFHDGVRGVLDVRLTGYALQLNCVWSVRDRSKPEEPIIVETETVSGAGPITDMWAHLARQCTYEPEVQGTPEAVAALDAVLTGRPWPSETPRPGPYAPDVSKMDWSPRPVVDFSGGGPVNRREAVPTPFGADRAREVHEKAGTGFGPRSDIYPTLMTDGERAYVRAVWDMIPAGSSSWMTAWQLIRSGFQLPLAAAPKGK